jgi:hypothetical protein
MANKKADAHRFVVLRHESGPGSQRPLHWDFMLEAGDSLRTWALATEPRGDQTIAAQGLPLHRLAYLDFEGEVSEGRGAVIRWDRGTYRVVSDTGDQLTLELAGARLRGTASLARQNAAGDQWTFRLSSGRAATSG